MKLFTKLALVSAVAVSSNAMAMQAMDDAALSATTGQDGISIGIGISKVDIAKVHVFDGDGLAAAGAAGAPGFGGTATTGAITLNNVDADSARLVTATGRHVLNNVNVTGNLNIEVDTGTVKLMNVKSDNLTVDSDTGTITLKDTVVTNTLCLAASTGSINFDKRDAHDIYARTSTGSIKGSLLTGKVFGTKTNTGTISVPSNTAGAGVCDLRTDTGVIKITIAA